MKRVNTGALKFGFYFLIFFILAFKRNVLTKEIPHAKELDKLTVKQKAPAILLVKPFIGYDTKTGAKTMEMLEQLLNYNPIQIKILEEGPFSSLGVKVNYILSGKVLFKSDGKGEIALSLLDKYKKKSYFIKQIIAKNTLRKNMKDISMQIFNFMDIKINHRRWERHIKNGNLSVYMWTKGKAIHKADEFLLYYQSTQDCYISIYQVISDKIKRVIPNKEHPDNFLEGGRIRSTSLKVKKPAKMMFKIVATVNPSGIVNDERFRYKHPPMLVIPVLPVLFGDYDGGRYYPIYRNLYSTDFINVEVIP